MNKQIGFFGGTTRGHVMIEGAPRHRIPFHRDVWFDRDIDGRWLVCVADTGPPNPECLGAIVVKDASVGRFIELLGALITDPTAFADELVLMGPSCTGR